MPLYEYECEQDGTVIELLRSAAQADDPVTDPAGKGRKFKRRLSTFAQGSAASAGPGSLPQSSGCCPCGKRAGGCGAS